MMPVLIVAGAIGFLVAGFTGAAAAIVLAGLVLCFITLSPMLRGWRPRLHGDGERSDALVKDPFCGTYVLRSRAFRRESDGEELNFCSADCAARFARGEQPVRGQSID